MKVGDYVRTDDGFISKYIGKNKNKWCMSGHLSFESTIRDIRFEDLEEDNIIWESEIEQGFVKIKSSPNIIDLIEVGDYVNGCLIVEINKDPFIKGQINLWTNMIVSEGEPFPNFPKRIL